MLCAPQFLPNSLLCIQYTIFFLSSISKNKGVVIPLWIFVFGQIVFERDYLAATYSSFLWNIIYLMIPLCIGVTIQYFFPNTMKFAKRSMACLIHIYVIVYIAFLIVTYWNMFTEDLLVFTWKVS